MKERVTCPVCGKKVLLVNGRLRSHGFSFGFPRPLRTRCKGSGRQVEAVRRPLRLVPGLYVSAPLKARAQELGLTATVVEGLPSNQWFLVTETGEHERRDPRYPCRRCRCPGFGYELGEHPGICFCNHDDGEHGPRRSALRRWLRSTAAADNWARVEEERNERERADRATASDALSAVFGRPVEVLPPAGFTFPHFAVTKPFDQVLAEATDALKVIGTGKLGKKD